MPTEVAIKNINDDDNNAKASSNHAVPILSDSTMSGSCSSPTLKKQTSKSVSKPKSALREKNLERLMIAGNSGWVREIIKGDRKNIDSAKIRIAYLPPKSLNINRIFCTRQLKSFLESHCNSTNLTKDNFSFSPRVFGLGLPWEVVRHANVTKKVARSEKRACLPVNTNFMGSKLEGVNYSPMQEAMPPKPKKNMPGRNNKLSQISRTGIVEGKRREKSKPLVKDSEYNSTVKVVQASKIKGIEVRNTKDPMKKDTEIQFVSRKVEAGGDMTQDETPKEVAAKSLEGFTKLNIQEVKKPGPLVSLAGPESMDLPDIEIIGFRSGSNNNNTVAEGSSSCPIDYDSEGTKSRAFDFEGSMEIISCQEVPSPVTVLVVTS